MLRALFIFSVLFVITHWSACGFMMLAVQPEVGPRSKSWFSSYWESYHDADPNALPTRIRTVYLWSLFYTMETLSTVGWGDIYVVNEWEAMYMIVLLITTLILSGLVVGGMSTMILASDAAWNHHKHKVDTMKVRQLPSLERTAAVVSRARRCRLHLRAQLLSARHAATFGLNEGPPLRCRPTCGTASFRPRRRAASSIISITRGPPTRASTSVRCSLGCRSRCRRRFRCRRTGR